MVITVDAAMAGLGLVLLANLCAGVWYLSKQGQITKQHESYHAGHRADIKELDQTQRHHSKTLAVHASKLETLDHDRNS